MGEPEGATACGGLRSLADDRDKKPKTRAADKPADPPMGPALRSVYQQTVEEAIPAEMLDLLSKLD